MESAEHKVTTSLSMGRFLGFMAVILLLVGPFLPNHVWENEETGELDEVSGLHRWYEGRFESLIPFLSVIFIVILLYPGFPFHFEKDTRFGKANHLFLLVWGGLLFLGYLLEALFGSYTASGWMRYPGSGLWMIILGSFLMALAGYLEWKYPTMDDLLVILGIMTGKRAETVVEIKPQATIPVKTQEVRNKPEVKVEPQKHEQEVEPKPSVVSPPVEQKEQQPETRELTPGEEKMLQRWIRHIDEYNQTYELCPKCNNYAFMKARDTGVAIVFTCPECNEGFTLKK